jgi:nucleotide-binding universal stress UspA family protein
MLDEMLFHKILYAYDGSDGAIDAFKLALAIAKQNRGELHIVSVGEIDYFPQFVEDIRDQRRMAIRRLRTFVFRARALAADSDVKLHPHVLVGHPVRAIVGFALKLNAELLVIGARGHSALH